MQTKINRVKEEAEIASSCGASDWTFNAKDILQLIQNYEILLECVKEYAKRSDEQTASLGIPYYESTAHETLAAIGEK
jgi:hypothetical protein